LSSVSQDQIYESFISETAELLEELETSVINLEQNPNDKETVDKIFRALHSLKGNSSLLGLDDIKRFVHMIENMVDKIRERTLDVTTHVINLLLEASDHCKEIYQRLPEDIHNIPLTHEENEFMERVKSLINPSSDDSTNQDLRASLLKFFAHPEIQIELQTNDALISLAGLIQDSAPLLLEDRRTGTGGERVSYLYKGVNISRGYGAIKTVLKEVEEGNFSDTQYSIVRKNFEDLIAIHETNKHEEPISLFTSLLEDIEMLYQDESGFDDIMSMLVGEALEKYEEDITLPEAEEAEEEHADAEIVDKPANKGKKGKSLSRQIKIDQEKLDTAIDTAGELVTISEFFNYINSQISIDGNMGGQLSNFRDATISLQEISEKLSSDLYDVRKVAIEESFQKLPRIVRDEQKALGKKVSLAITGNEIMVDKSLVSKLETIIVHMIRNSIDHGLEKPQDRIANGKPEEGIISINVTSDETMMFIEISDDGGGINLTSLKKKALEAGLYTESALATMSDTEATSIMFEPGISTAKEVTETSGRGVGMDIVTSTIHEMGGTTIVKTADGLGSSITLKFPLAQTTIVKKGLAVSVGNSIFLVPIEVILESFRLHNGELSSIRDDSEIVNRRGKITPLIRLYELFGIETNTKDPYDAILLLVEEKKKRICFMVDSILGQRQIIYKDLGINTLSKPSPFEGVSVYDGSHLAMILDVQGIIEQTQI